ncbi:MAG: YdiU family protein [Reichenbachiella sp.]
MWHLEYSYKDQLPEQFYSEQAPDFTGNSSLVCFNDELAKELGIDDVLADKKYATNILSGNETIAGSHPIAQAYAGHQFGQFTMLGDGRAVLLGEQLVNDVRYDIQLKGSGATKFSRRGDGRATLPSMLREYLMSEAMHHLGIPTTRSLAVAKTQTPVYREEQKIGGVLTRVAQSHIRVGTFEYARFFCPPEQIETLTQYVINRHYPEIVGHKNYALELLKSVMDRQIDLLVHWMRVGFIHGVMNTDNMSIAGETIDYGPCSFMNVYHPDTVYSSIDRQSRYAYINQPPIAHWNLSVFANVLIPIIDQDEKVAVSKVKEVLDSFSGEFSKRYIAMMCRKLGIADEQKQDKALVNDLLMILAENKVDYTNFFVSLRYQSIADERLLSDDKFTAWYGRWRSAHERNGDQQAGWKLMDKNNPVVIPRNHLVEEVLSKAEEGDFSSFDQLLTKLKDPYAQNHEVQSVPKGFDQVYQTYCGT